ncbi:unnamed protein product [Sympodiomycopsis kandeliae]
MTVSTSAFPLAGLWELLTFTNVLIASIVVLVALCVLYPDRPVGVASRSGIANYKPAYPLVGSVDFILRISFRQTRFLDEVLRVQRDHGKGGQPFTITFPALGGRATVLNNPAYIQYVQKTNFDNYPKGREFYKNMSDVLGPHGIFVVDGSPWYTQRKLASHIFSIGNFKSHVQNVVTHSVRSKLDPLLVDLSNRDQATPLPDLMFRFTLSSFAYMAFNADLHCLPSEAQGLAIKNEFAGNFDYAQNVMDHRFFSVGPPWFEWFTSEGAQMRKAIKALHQYCYKIIDARLERRGQAGGRDSEKKASSYEEEGDAPGVMSKGGKDLLDLFIDQGLDRKELLPVILNFLIAGRDTTAQSLSWLFYELYKNPQYISKIRETLVPVLGPPSQQREMTFEDHKDLPFLQACFYEAVRLYPAVPKNLKHVQQDDIIRPIPVSSTGDSLPSIDLPNVQVKKGESITWSDWVMARMPEVWGDDCEEFKPERFYDAETNACKEFSQWKFHSFNGGPRVCLGKTLAVYEGMSVAAAILGRFDVHYDDQALQANPPTYQDSLTLPCSPYDVKFKLRPEARDD